MTANNKREQQDSIVEGVVTQSRLPVVNGDKADDDATEFDVADIEFFECGDGTVTITDFLNGFHTQKLYVLGKSGTTIGITGNIVTKSGSPLALANDTVYHFYCANEIWYEV